MEHNAGLNTDVWLLDNPQGLLSLDKWQKTVNLLARIYKAPASFLVQYTEKGYQVTIASKQSTNPYPAGIVIEPDANIFCRKIVETGDMLYVSNAHIDPCWDTNPEVHQDGFSSYLGVPVFWPNGKPFGTFCVMDYAVTDYDADYLELIGQLKEILEADLSLIDAFIQTKKLATTDPLTNLNNRRGFYTLSGQLISLAKRMSTALSLFYFDIDKFKRINDQYGHLIGDKVLEAVSQALLATTRNNDVLGRMGGDEFVALVSLTDEHADKIIQRFNDNLHMQIEQQQLPDFSVSVGHTPVDLSVEIKTALKQADQAMFVQKKAKLNRP